MSDPERTHPSFLHRLRDRGDGACWPEFHAKYGHMLYRYARSVGAAHNDAEDVVQDVEMQFFQALDGFAYDAKRGYFRGYLRAAVLHALGRRAARRARQPVEMDPQQLQTMASAEGAQQDASWDLEWELNRLRCAVRAIANDFDPATLKAFEMYVLAGCSADETAAALEISKWCVYRARNRVLARLRNKLTELPGEEVPGRESQ